MSVATELTRIQTAKSDLKTSIEAKGVQVPNDALISTYSGYVDQIQTGGGGISPNYTTAVYLFASNRFTDVFADMLSYSDTSNWANALNSCRASNFTQAKIDALIARLQASAQRPENLVLNSLFNLCNGDWGNFNFNLDLKNFQPVDQNRDMNLINMFAFSGTSSTTPIGDITIDTLNEQSDYHLGFRGLGTIRTSGNLKIYSSYDGSAWSSINICSNFYGAGKLYEFHIVPTNYTGADTRTVDVANLSVTQFDLDALKRTLALYTGNTLNIKIRVISALRTEFLADADAVALAQANNITIG